MTAHPWTGRIDRLTFWVIYFVKKREGRAFKVSILMQSSGLPLSGLFPFGMFVFGLFPSGLFQFGLFPFSLLPFKLILINLIPDSLQCLEDENCLYHFATDKAKRND